MVKRKVFQSHFRAVSDPFGGRSRGFALFQEEAELKQCRFRREKPLGELENVSLLPLLRNV